VNGRVQATERKTVKIGASTARFSIDRGFGHRVGEVGPELGHEQGSRTRQSRALHAASLESGRRRAITPIG
jgi:hypothetical protein